MFIEVKFISIKLEKRGGKNPTRAYYIAVLHEILVRSMKA